MISNITHVLYHLLERKTYFKFIKKFVTKARYREDILYILNVPPNFPTESIEDILTFCTSTMDFDGVRISNFNAG